MKYFCFKVPLQTHEFKYIFDVLQLTVVILIDVQIVHL